MATQSLPWEIIVDILSRLGVKDLLRYRSVAKPWCSLIDGPDFIKKHLKRSVGNFVVFGGRNDLYQVDPETLNRARRLNHPLGAGIRVDVLGGCDGLVALASKSGDVAIWNPSTRRHRALPISELEQPPDYELFEFVLTGFGYDPVSDDHKLFRMMNFHGFHKPVRSETKVYSLKANAWKRIGDFPHCFLYQRGYGVLARNALHWLVTRKSDRSLAILSFELSSEELSEVPLPAQGGVERSFMSLGSLGGCLCASVRVNFDFFTMKSERVDVWVMKEHRVRESWTKLFSVARSSATGSFGDVVPVVYLKGGDRVLMVKDGEKFFVYDVKTKVAMKVRRSNVPLVFDTHVCVRSLVGVGGDGEKSAEKEKGDDFLSENFKLVNTDHEEGEAEIFFVIVGDLLFSV